MLKELFSYMKQYKKYALISLVCIAVECIFELIIPLIMADMVDVGIANGDQDYILHKGLVMIGCAGLALVLGICSARFCALCGQGFGANLREAEYRKLQSYSFSNIDHFQVSSLVTRLTSDVTVIQNSVSTGIRPLCRAPVMLFMATGSAFVINARLALVFLVALPVLGFLLFEIVSHVGPLYTKMQTGIDRVNRIVQENLTAVRVVKAFGHEQQNVERFDEINERLEKCSLQAIFYSSLTNPCTRFVNNVVYAGVALAGALVCVACGGVGFTVGSLSALLSYANQYTKPFNEISGVVTELQNALACASRIFQLIAEPPQTPDAPDARVLKDAQGQVEMKDVSFSYVPDRKLIEALNLSVKPGQHVAIVGPTGCGKTTLINLLMRFYDVNGGAIRVDGTDVRQITRASLRANYGMVLQETWLKSGTIRENLVMGKPDATDEEVIAAARACHAHSFIKRLPQGYDTVIGEDGGRLSQGQKQLLCITRIMLCLPPMLILDEATSSIDTRTELKIQHAFTTMMDGRTTFIVAHRLSTIREADVILVMRDGSIVEMGSHEALLQRNGFYAKLYNSQFAA